tara:strand:+ start:1283 stop:1855 length:573 start_codon:yes stop_codon:yes gene_type:complete
VKKLQDKVELENAVEVENDVDELSNILENLDIKVEGVEDVIGTHKRDIVFEWLLRVQLSTWRMFRGLYNHNSDQIIQLMVETFSLMFRYFKDNEFETRDIQLVALCSWSVINKLFDDEYDLDNSMFENLCAYAYKKREFSDMEFKLIKYVKYSESMNNPIPTSDEFFDKYVPDKMLKNEEYMKDLRKMIC